MEIFWQKWVTYPKWNGFVKYELWQNFYIEKKLTNDKSEDSSYKMHSVSKQNKNAKKYLTASTNDYITLWKPSKVPIL